MPAPEPVFASRAIAEWLGAFEVCAVPPEIRPDDAVRLWRKIDRAITARTHLTVFAEGGVVLAWPRVPEPIEPRGEHA